MIDACWIAAVLVLGLPAADPAPLRATSLERRFFLLGTEARLTVTAPSITDALAASERAYRALADAEARLSTWTTTSELARLNAAPLGTAVPLSPELTEELAAAFACRVATAGAFDPEVGHLVTAWDLRGSGREPHWDEIAQLAAEARTVGFELDVRTGSVVRRGGRTLEEGAWGKGAALDRALAGLGSGVTGEIDLGGQLVLSPDRAATVAVTDPRDRDRPLVELDLRGGSVSTSGNGERGLWLGGHRLGHLLDPRNGRPAPDFGSVTVWAKDGLLADCLSTGLYVAGPEAALEFAARHPEVAVVVVEIGTGDHRRVRASAGLLGRLHALASDLDLEVESAPERPGAGKKEGAGTFAPLSDRSRLLDEP